MKSPTSTAVASSSKPTTLNTNSVYRRPAFLFRLDSSATLTQRSDEEERDDRAVLDFSYVRYRGRRLLVSGALGFETNESLGLELRSQVSGLVGLRLVNTNRAQFEIQSLTIRSNSSVVLPACVADISSIGHVRRCSSPLWCRLRIHP